MKATTYQLLRVIGSPFLESQKIDVILDVDELYSYSKNNRMPLLFLRSIVESGLKTTDYMEYEILSNKWIEIEKRIKKIIKVLDDNYIKYSTFKSIKPYNEVTVDIDFLIFNSYECALEKIEDSGYRLLARGPLSSTFRDPGFKIDYDIYDEVGVSNIIYFDKDKCLNYIIKKKLLSGGFIDSFSPSVDLLSIIAHSVIKEQMYTLAEYYSTLYYLKGMKENEVLEFIRMAEYLKLRTAVKAHLGLTFCIHRMAHGFDPPPLSRLVSIFGLNGLEIERGRSSGYRVPHKFHPTTLMNCFWEKLYESKARRSFAKQARSMVNPEFVRNFVPQFISHIVRETY